MAHNCTWPCAARWGQPCTCGEAPSEVPDIVAPRSTSNLHLTVIEFSEQPFPTIEELESDHSDSDDMCDPGSLQARQEAWQKRLEAEQKARKEWYEEAKWKAELEAKQTLITKKRKARSEWHYDKQGAKKRRKEWADLSECMCWRCRSDRPARSKGV